MVRKWLVVSGVAGPLILAVPGAQATHIPVALDVPAFRPPLDDEGYLNFVHPGPAPVGPSPLGPPAGGQFASGTEEFTGWTALPILAAGDVRDLFFDNGLSYADRADFDWVVENRMVQNPPFGGGNHPGVIGALTWEIAPTQPSFHIFVASIFPPIVLPHAHLGVLPVCADMSRNLCNDDFTGDSFNVVDVFSQISFGGDPLVSDVDIAAREAALDYILGFCNANTGECAAGTPIAVYTFGWIPGVADDYVARWGSPFPATHVLIDAAPFQTDGSHHDLIVQIDAIKAAVIPDPPTLFLLGAGLAGLAAVAWTRQRRRSHGLPHV